MATKILPRDFYERPTLEVAHEMLGKWICFQANGTRLASKIVEVEAYIGQDDPACHAASGKTKRTAVMFGPGGHSHIYLIYGMYHCLNLVTEPDGKAAALLLRAAEPREGIKTMLRNSPATTKPEQLLSGPGKLCRSFGLSLEQNRFDLTSGSLTVEDHGESVSRICQTSRIGIRKGTEKNWRFYDADSASVSARPKKELASTR